MSAAAFLLGVAALSGGFDGPGTRTTVPMRALGCACPACATVPPMDDRGRHRGKTLRRRARLAKRGGAR